LALEYLVTERSVYLFTVRPGRVEARRLNTTPAALARSVARFRELLAGRDPGFRSEGEALWTLLVGPAGALPAAVTILPDGPLWDLPFAALARPGGGFLIDETALASAPSLAFLQEAAAGRRPADPAARPLFVASPAVENSAADTRALAASFPGARIAEGEQLRKDRLRPLLSGASWAHFSVHGLLEPDAPLFSRLQLAAAGGEESYLEAWELAQLPLRARLAVLAACESGRGKALAGEGLIGLSWGFLAAGTPATVASLWKVDTSSTTALFREFYAAWSRAGTASPAIAPSLRAAARALRQRPETAHPYHWAAFVALGDVQ
jgi:CHAT domain-containing protein